MSASPVRTCVGCRKRAARAELLRVVAEVRPDSPVRVRVVPDPKGLAPGRGAHLHPTPQCLELAVRRRAFTRALRLSGGGLDLTPVETLVQQWAAPRAEPGAAVERGPAQEPRP